jgi:nucleotide-binding universal stress UspA family protein
VVTIGNHSIQPSGEKVVEYLKWHGIDAESIAVADEKSLESSTLLAAALSFEADLIVLGAYTRHRTGRPVFGSMTIDMIKQNKIPVFMAH